MLMFALLLVLPVTAPPPVAAASLKDQIAAAKDRQADLTASIARSQRLVEDLKREEAATRDALAATKEELTDIRADQDAVRERIEQVTERLERIEERHAELVDEQRQTDFTLGLLEQELANGEDDLKARRQSLGRRLAEAHRAENTTLLEQVFTAESFSDVLTDTSAYLAYGDQDAQLARQITQDQQALDNLRLLTTSTRLQTDQLRRATLETQAQVEELREKLREAKARLAQLEKQTEKARERQAAQILALAATKKEAQQRVREQIAARAQLRSRIDNLVASAQRRASAQFGGVAPGGGNGIFDWPTTGYISQDYGCTGYWVNPPRGDCPHFHDGIDIANGSGTPDPCRWRRCGGLRRLQPLGVGAGLHGGHRAWRRHVFPVRPHAAAVRGQPGTGRAEGPAHRLHGQHRRRLRHAPSLGGLAGRRLAARQPSRLPVGRARAGTAGRGGKGHSRGAQRSFSTQTWPP